MKKLVKCLFITPASLLAVLPAVSCGCSTGETSKDVVPTDKLVIKNGVLSGFVDGFNPKEYKSLEIPNTVTTISENAFTNNFTGSDCQLTKIIIPNSVVTIYSKAFYNCDAITTYDVSTFNVEIINKCEWASDAFGNSASTGTIVYPTTNGETLDNLIDYKLCDSGLAIGWFDLTKERTVEIKFLDISAENVLSGFTSDFDTTPHTSLFTILSIPYYVETISKNAFFQEDESTLKNIKTINFNVDPDLGYSSLQRIGEYAFKECAVTKLSFKEGLVTIASNAFENCEQLAEIELPYTLVNVGDSAFLNCGKLSKLIIPANLSTIGANAFKDCNSLNYIDVSKKKSKPDAWDTSAFDITSKGGQIICEPSNAGEWKEYFSNLISNEWSITDKVNILNGYTSLITPYKNKTTLALSDIAALYLNTTNQISQIFIDDLYHSFYEWTKTDTASKLNLTKFDLLIQNVAISSNNKTASFDVFYEIAGNTYGESQVPFEAEGSWSFVAVPFNVSSGSTEIRDSGLETERKFLQLNDNTFGQDRWWHIVLNEKYKVNSVEGEIQEEDKYIYKDVLSTLDITDYTKVGILMAINQFIVKDASSAWSWSILSSYLQNITIE